MDDLFGTHTLRRLTIMTSRSRGPPAAHGLFPTGKRLAAVAVLGEREPQLSAVQRLALVDAAAWWLSGPNGGEELAHALLSASCSAVVTTEHVYLALNHSTLSSLSELFQRRLSAVYQRCSFLGMASVCG
jgi:hypothetical protein